MRACVRARVCVIEEKREIIHVFRNSRVWYIGYSMHWGLEGNQILRSFDEIYQWDYVFTIS